MNRGLAKAVRFFVAPAEMPAFAPPRPRATVAGVLAAEADLLVTAGAVAASLRRDARAGAVLVCAWRGHDAPPLAAPAPAAPSAARLASKLSSRGLAARACGLVCVVELPAAPDDAIAAFRAAVAAAEGPAVLALARRDEALDPLLAEADRLVLGVADDADPALAELAFERLAHLGPPAQCAQLPRGVLARQAARLGLSTPAGPEPAPREAPAAAVKESLS